MPTRNQLLTLAMMDQALNEFMGLVPRPSVVAIGDARVYRHVEKLPQQAVVQKLSRVISGLRGASVLCDAGLFQEQAALHRVIDEIGEDVLFLCLSAGKAELSEEHDAYLSAFFEEEFDLESGAAREKGRNTVSRRKIRAVVAKAGDDDPSGHVRVSRTVHSIDSGYVHAASPHIMDSYLGSPPRFHTNGMLGTHREPEYRWSLDNYFFRSVRAFQVAAYCFGRREIAARLDEVAGLLESDLDAAREQLWGPDSR